MRFLVKVSMPVEHANKAFIEGRVPTVFEGILNEIRPEHAWFTEIDGCRTCFMIVNLANAHEVPRVAEPWFLAFGANVEFHPAMTPEDLARAGTDIEHAVKEYGMAAK